MERSLLRQPSWQHTDIKGWFMSRHCRLITGATSVVFRRFGSLLPVKWYNYVFNCGKMCKLLVYSLVLNTNIDKFKFLYLPCGKASSSPISLLHRDPPQVYTTARRNARPHNRSVFVLSCVWTCATHHTHSSIAVKSRDFIELSDTRSDTVLICLTHKHSVVVSHNICPDKPFYEASPMMSHAVILR